MKPCVEYDEELALQLCTRIAQGEALVRICATEGMPNVTSVYRWLKSNAPFRDMYQMARDDQADTLADEIVAISDEAPTVQRKDADGNDVLVPIVLDAAAVQRQRLRVEARKWVAAKLKPKKYGDRQEIVGAGGEALIPGAPFDSLTLAQQLEGARRIVFVLKRAGELQAEANRPKPHTPPLLTHDQYTPFEPSDLYDSP